MPSERELSERYGVGKSSVREAIKMLQVLGVVASEQGKGTYLRKSVGTEILRPLLLDMMLQQSTAEELYEFRLMFDCAYMRIAAAKATEEAKSAAKDALLEYAKLQRTHMPEADESDQRFHRIMLEATRNPFIIKVGTLVMELCRPYSNMGNNILDETVLENHKKLLEIFCSGNTEGLEDAVEKSLCVFRNILNGGAKHD